MFVASKILALITQPLTWVIVLLMLVLCLPVNKAHLMKRLVAVSLVFLVGMGWEPVPDFLMRQLESRYPEIASDADLSGFAGVVVLGGALDSGYIAQSHQQPVLNSSAERMTAVVTLWQRHPHLRVIFTGGEGNLFANGPTEAERAKVFFDSLGVSGKQLQFEDKSRNTYENAIFTARMPDVDKTQRWLLVTSAWHMPRSMASFEKAGWNVQAYPVDFRTGKTTPLTAYSLKNGLASWQLVLHEWVGIMAYKLFGRA